MSNENIDPTVMNLMDSLPELLKKPTTLDKQNIEAEEAAVAAGNTNNIFDLIDHLNEKGCNNNEQQTQNNMSVLSSTPTESQSQIDDSKDNDVSLSGGNAKSSQHQQQMDLILNSIEPIQVEAECSEVNTSQSSEISSADGSSSAGNKSMSDAAGMQVGKTRIPVFGSARTRQVSASSNQTSQSSISNTASASKISRIAVFTKPKPTAAQTTEQVPSIKIQPVQSQQPRPSQPQSGLKKPVPIPKARPQLEIKSKQLAESTNLKSRISPRSFSRDVSSVSVKPKQSSIEVMDSKQMSKRGVSLSAGISQTSLTSSASRNEENLVKGEKKNIRYAVRHKPRESKVKIFSQKMEIKNVASKIGSLKNYDHKPAGGDVIIETRPLNWNAQSKIKSLENAATYTPSGGNVKIEDHKLNWKANAKIGSLDKAASYVPHGGNVKIESHKLNFKARARPKTDTGLIYIESDDFDDSQNLSLDYLNDTQDLSS